MLRISPVEIGVPFCYLGKMNQSAKISDVLLPDAQLTGDSKPLSRSLLSVDSPEGRQCVAEHLKSCPYPHYEQAESPGLLLRIDADGCRTIGRFVNRNFRPLNRG